MSFPGVSMLENLPTSVGDMGLVPGSGKSSGEVNGNPLAYSCLENPIVREALWATVQGLQRVGQGLVTEQLQQCKSAPINSWLG